MEATDLGHRLVAILAGDAVGYSRLMSNDDRSTVIAIEAARRVFGEQTSSNGGRVIDTAGDSVLAVFNSAGGAVAAAMAVQQLLTHSSAHLPANRQMHFRIGVHLGDVIEKADGTVYGDGVNIAARLQTLAEPGGIAVSESIRTAVKGKLAVEFQDQGEHRVKNIADPLRVYRLALTSQTTRMVSAAQSSISGVRELDLSMPTKPSIAVLPLTNMSDEPEQEYFCDGISDDIITELSRFHSLFVIARNSSFTYKRRPVDVRTVANELGVRYVLEGSVRRVNNRIRLTAQLIDALSGNHIWAEKYDREVTEIFEVQEELTQRIVVSIAPFIDEAERDKVRRRPDNFGAYEIGVRAFGKAYDAYRRFDPATINQAITDARSALAIDPKSTIALIALAFCQWQHIILGTAHDRNAAWHEGIDAATEAIETDRNDCKGYAFKSLLLAFAPQLDRANDALSNAQRAHELNPHDMPAIATLAFSEAVTGHAMSAIDRLHEVLRISPRDPLRFSIHNQLSMTYFLAGLYVEGAAYAELGIEEAPGLPQLHAHLALNAVGLGDLPRARAAFAVAQRIGPGWIERALAGGLVFRDQEQLTRATNFLRIAAGLESHV